MIAEMLLLSVAVWRVSHLVTSEVGPARILERFRTWAGVVVEVLDDGSEEVIVSPGTLAELVTCEWCVSVWVGMAAACLYAISPRSCVLLAMPFSLSAMALLYGQVMAKFTNS